jgi:hypothetical protein
VEAILAHHRLLELLRAGAGGGAIHATRPLDEALVNRQVRRGMVTAPLGLGDD